VALRWSVDGGSVEPFDPGGRDDLQRLRRRHRCCRDFVSQAVAMTVPVIEQDRPHPGQAFHQLDERSVKRLLR